MINVKTMITLITSSTLFIFAHFCGSITPRIQTPPPSGIDVAPSVELVGHIRPIGTSFRGAPWIIRFDVRGRVRGPLWDGAAVRDLRLGDSYRS